MLRRTLTILSLIGLLLSVSNTPESEPRGEPQFS